MTITHILQEFRGRGRLITLEKGTGLSGGPYRIKTVTIKNFPNEQSAREAFNLMLPLNARSKEADT